VDKRLVWFVTALSVAIGLWSFYTAVGGFSGMVRDPKMALAIFAILAPIMGLSLWLSFRRLRKNPTIVRIETPKSETPSGESLENAPLVFVASRRKILAVVALGVCLFGLVSLMTLGQTGVCRVGFGVSTLPGMVWLVAVWLWYLWDPPLLTLSPDGLRYKSKLLDRRWTWDEVREVSVSKFSIPIISRFSTRRPSLFVMFRRFGLPGALSGPPSAGVRSIWKISGEDLGALLTAAHLKWSTPDQDRMTPIPRTFQHYARQALGIALGLFFVWILMAQPCGPMR
jgi:hypothetical protein